MNRILITGGSGFIGTNLVEHFRIAGSEVLNVDIAKPRNEKHAGNWRCIDIMEKANIVKAVAEFLPDVIFHLAARTDLDGVDVSEYEANTVGVRNVIKAAREIPDLRRIVFSSSMLVCELGYAPVDEYDYRPTTYYGESKVVGEKIVRQDAGDLPWTIVRPTSIWGPWFGVPYRNFFEAVLGGYYFHPRGLEVRRSYGFVLNSVHQLSNLVIQQRELIQGKTFYLADYEPIELRNWADMISEEAGLNTIRQIPRGVFHIAAKTGDLLHRLGVKNFPMTSFRLNNLQTNSVFAMDALEKVCGEIPYDTMSGVKMTLDWMRSEGQM